MDGLLLNTDVWLSFSITVSDLATLWEESMEDEKLEKRSGADSVKRNKGDGQGTKMYVNAVSGELRNGSVQLTVAENKLYHKEHRGWGKEWPRRRQLRRSDRTSCDLSTFRSHCKKQVSKQQEESSGLDIMKKLNCGAREIKFKLICQLLQS